jgi:hypothetical protein
VTETPQEAYDRGHAAGGIEARLDQYDLHFAAINGSVADTAAALTALSMQVQRLADQAVARDATVLTTAAALKDAEDARRAKSEQTWSPFQRIVAAVAGIAGIVAAVLGIKALTGK